MSDCCIVRWRSLRRADHSSRAVLRSVVCLSVIVNLLTPNVDYSGRTAPLTSKCCILYTYSTNIGTEYFKHGIYCLFFPLQNAVCFINLTYLVPVLFTFYIQGVLKFKKIILYSLLFPLQNAVCFINLTYLVPVLFTFYIQGVLKLKK